MPKIVTVRPVEVVTLDPAPLSYLEKAILAEIECIRGNDAAIKVRQSIANDEWRRGNDAESRRQREECARARTAISECFARIHVLIEASSPPF